MQKTLRMSAAALSDFLDREFPQIHLGGRAFFVVAVSPGEAVLRLEAGERHLRPGGTVSGPTLFTLADLAAYAVVLAHIGPVPLAVTTNLTINFLRRPPPGPLLGRARLLKLGRRLAIAEIGIFPEAGATESDPLAHAVATYSLPDAGKVT